MNVQEHFRNAYPHATITKEKALSLIDEYSAPQSGARPMAERIEAVFGKQEQMLVADFFDGLDKQNALS